MADSGELSPIQGSANDLAELGRLVENAPTPYIRDVLTREMELLRKTLQSSKPNEEQHSQRQTTVYTPLTSFSWDQSETVIEIFIPIPENVVVSQANLTVTLNPTQCTILVQQVPNWSAKRFHISCLYSAIDPAQSKVTVHPKRIKAKLKKKDKAMWPSLQKKSVVKPSSDPKFEEEEGDNQADPRIKWGSETEEATGGFNSILSTMSKLYNEGDDEMKQAISRAWADASSHSRPDMMK